MSRIEEELRATFERHEDQTPATGPVRDKINIAWVRAKRRRLLLRTTGAAAAVVIAGAALPIVFQQWQQSAQQPTNVTVLSSIGPSEPAVAGPLDVLVIGSENRLTAASGDPHADTVAMIHISADRSRAYVVGLPRAEGSLRNSVARGGPEMTTGIVSAFTGVDFTATATVDYRAFRAITDAVNGIEVCRSKQCEQLDADTVTPVLRTDPERVLQALATRVITDGTVTDPGRIAELVRAGGNGVTMDGDTRTLLGAAATLADAKIVAVSAPKDPEDLYAAIRSDGLAEWVLANPGHVLR
ncbi:hypothetical protein GCM10010435_65360 [Winogradskya consettensis]|uniref:Cell envelope-related transcriptional attenuator domain-containing protein n=1 Tax=Winogradskya consettensis TaxID=113560 RepID=A0A919T4R7_9ACTN|nr:LCP family protein [Actinoplanes consettensis]GIM84902.1 hypothetical protein Aco04nite_93730 [Actinoplanes consettensis]